MRKSTIIKTLSEFDGKLSSYAETIAKFYHENPSFLSKEEVEDIFESYHLRISAIWENFIENLIIDLFNQDTSRFSDYTGYKIEKHLSRDTCKAILLGIRFMDFKSTGDLISFSKKILPEKNNPFLRISKHAWRRIDEFYIIRNYLSHNSDAAKRSLKKMYINNYKINKFIKPGKFLMMEDDRRAGHNLAKYLDAMDWVAMEIDSFFGLSQKFYIKDK